ncbi:MAG: 2-oxo acid dehydrogenase subunit E2 [Saprospiraceae bacterium]|nr:2-oxo acid dehydrogenase subunit E2 [Saprospiraceae bacterium]MBP9209951.1 2-oxo acid dehydrogenase subunit E2 [Saprospiraceae bacterium]
MATVIKMPRLSDTMTEGFIKSWSKRVGDRVKPGDVLAEVETDKATMDLEAYEDGVLLHIAIPSGGVPVDSIIAILGKEGEAFEHLLNDGTTSVAVEPLAAPASIAEATAVSGGSSPEVLDETRIKASPLARSIAREKGIALSAVRGSGDHGRIVKRDLEELSSTPSGQAGRIARPQSPSDKDREVPVSQMRKTIARRLAESKFAAPHFYLTTEVRMDACIAAREQLNERSTEKISFNDLIAKACASALRAHPAVNVSWQGDKMVYHGSIHLGIAVAIDDGLVVPVVRDADHKSLTELHQEIADLATRAKDRKLVLEEMQGNTFTLSNLGMFDIDHFTAIINPPDACILAVGSIRKQPAVVNDELVISNLMKMTLSCDHRAVDGATGARFLQTLKGFLEAPVAMLL